MYSINERGDELGPAIYDILNIESINIHIYDVKFSKVPIIIRANYV